MLAPVIVFVYNRPDHTKKLIESLRKNQYAKESKIYIFSDAAKNEERKKDVLEVRKYVECLKEKNWFQEINIDYAEENRGLANSVITGVTEVINLYGKAIVLEDDLIVSPYFLKFMNEALDTYEDDNRIFSVSGFSRDIEYLKSANLDIYFSVRAQSWSWGTWKNRWELVDWNVSDYTKFKRNFRERRAFNAGGNDMASMLDRQQCGYINSWAIRFCYAQYKNHAYTVQPRKTLVVNGGQDGSGTHCNYVREMSVISEQDEWCFRKFECDKKINMELKKTRRHIPLWKLLGSYICFVIIKRHNFHINNYKRTK